MVTGLVDPAEAVIDVSEHQGDINFVACYQAGIRHCIVRGGIGGRVDLKLNRNMAGFRSAGIGVPALYWFINPKSSFTPEAQGDMARRVCANYGVKTMMLDAEWYTSEPGNNPVLSGQPYNDWLWRFVVAMGPDVIPIVYTSPSFWNKWGVQDNRFGELDTIIASYKGQRASSQSDHTVDGIAPQDWDKIVLGQWSLPALPLGWDTTLEGWQFSAGFNKQGPVYGMQSSDLDLNLVQPAALNRWYAGDPWSPGEVVPVPLPPPPVNPPIQPQPVPAYTVGKEDSMIGPYLMYANKGQTGSHANGSRFTVQTQGTWFKTDGRGHSYVWVRAKDVPDVQAQAAALGFPIEPQYVANLDAFGVLSGELPS